MLDENKLAAELEKLREKGLLREIKEFSVPGGKIRVGSETVLNLSSNDYLDIAGSPLLRKAAEKAVRLFGCGSGASRLVTGSMPCHTELEHRLAAFKGYPDALVFGSGYMTNAGVIPALAGRDDTVFADRLSHASIIDGIQLSRAGLKRFAHNDPEHLEAMLAKTPPKGRRLVITESVFSMDGDIAPLRQIADICAKFNALLLVDEAHAGGVFGKGRGLVDELGLNGQVDVSMGTMSKAMGGYGGFVVCSALLRQLFVNRARSFIFSTALPPAVAGTALGALDFIESHPDAGQRLLERAAYFRRLLHERGLNTGDSASQIIPVIIGDNTKVLRVSKKLREKGIIAAAIRAPTVPQGTERLRLSVTLAHTREDLENAAEIIAETIKHTTV